MVTETLSGKPFPAPVSLANARNAGIDSYKFLAFAGVVLIHTSHALDVGGPSIQGGLDQLSRFAVPFFFLASGYFLGVNGRNGWFALQRRFARIAAVFCFWSVFYILLAHPALDEVFTLRFMVKWLLSGGPGYHLWFLPSLLICLSTFLAMQAVLGNTWTVCGAIFLYLLGVAFGTYRAVLGLPDVHFNIHNGPFFGTLFVAIGFSIAKEAVKINSSLAAAMATSGAAIQITESMTLDRLGYLAFSANEFSLGTLPFAVGLFSMALNQVGVGTSGTMAFLGRLGGWSLGLYCVHVAYIWLFSKIFLTYGLFEVLLLAMMVITASAMTVFFLARFPFTHRLIA